MALSGTFKSMSPSDLLQMLSWGSKEGMLTCKRDAYHCHVFLQEGNVVGVTSSRYKDRLGALLLRLDYITNEQFDDIFGRQASNGRPIGEIFISENLVSENDLQKVLTYQAEEIVHDLLSWSDGEFNFEERNLSDQETRVTPVEISNLLLEGARRMDEISRLKAEFPDPESVLMLNPDIDMSDLELTRPQQVICTNLVTSMSVGDIFRMVNESEYDILTSLKSLHERSVLIEDIQATENRKQEKEKLTKLLDLSLTMEEKGWLHEALSNIEELLSKNPKQSQAIEIKLRLRKEIMKQAEMMFKTPDSIPTVRHAVASISVDKLHLNPREGFVFSRIDGRTDVKNLRYLTGMPRDELYLVLHKFVRMGLIYLDEKEKKARAIRR